MAWASPSASRMAFCRIASAPRMTACLSPSARVIAASRVPSASRTTARRVRSAFICSCMAFITSIGGSIRWISTRTTRTPHLSVASSSTWRMVTLTLSREVKRLSRVISPITLRRFVCANFVMAMRKLATL